MLISGQIYVLTIYVHIGVVNSGRHDSPHIRKSSLDHDFQQKMDVIKGEEAKRVASGGGHFRATSNELGLLGALSRFCEKWPSAADCPIMPSSPRAHPTRSGRSGL